MTERHGNSARDAEKHRQDELQRRINLPVEQGSEQASHQPLETMASAVMVNRTHRMIRERARNLQAQRSRARSLWMPLAVFSGLLLILCAAVWSVLDEYELIPTGIPDASQQMFVLIMWCLPISALLLAVVWMRRGGSARENTDNGNAQ